MVYTKHDLERLASERIVEDFKADKQMTFTNTSYGYAGITLCAIASNVKSIEKTISYGLERNYAKAEAKLVKVTRTTDWRTPKDRTEEREVILELYDLDLHEEVFTDNHQQALNSRGVRFNRYMLNKESISSTAKHYNKILEIGSSKYLAAKNYIETYAHVSLKKDVKISIDAIINKRSSGQTQLQVEYIYDYWKQPRELVKYTKIVYPAC